MRQTTLTLIAGALAALSAAADAHAQQRRQEREISATIVNRSGARLNNLHVTPASSLEWGADRLGSDTLDVDSRKTFRIERTPGCRYDVRAIYGDGSFDVETDVNLCASPTLTLTNRRGASPLRLVRLASRRPIGLFVIANGTGAEMNKLMNGEASQIDGATVDPGDETVVRFRHQDGCKVNLAAEFKGGDPIFVEKHDVCAMPLLALKPPATTMAVRFRNRSSYALSSLHVRPVGFESWGGDRLGSDTLQPRDIKRINIAPTSSCLFDVKATFSGSEPELRNSVNLCERKIVDVEGPELVSGKGDKKTTQALPDDKETLTLKVTNETPRSIREVFVSPARTRNWGENLLEAPLARGASASLAINQDGACLFDLKVVHEGGYEQRRMNYDLCRIDSLGIGGPFQNLIDGGGPDAGFPVSFVNVGRATVRSLHLTPSSDTHWGEDRLGSGQLERRSRLDIRLPRAGGCFWDIKIGYDEATTDEKRKVDLCSEPQQQLRKREKPGTVVATGTGFFISGEGHVLTNSHVAEGCRIVAIAREGEARIPLRMIRQDPETDLALLRADGAPTPFIALRRMVDAPVRPGERSIVVGYPVRNKLGVVNVTEGVVSAAGGAGQDQTRMQFTAPVQPGNSGGPILDGRGQAIGVVVARLGVLDDERASQNINFGVSVAAVEAFLKEAGVSLPSVEAGAEKPTPDVFAQANAAVLPLDCLE